MWSEITAGSISLVIAVTLGYIAYSFSYIGLRRGHSARDMIFISLVYGLIPITVWESFGFVDKLQQIVSGFIAVIATGIFWRTILRDLWYAAMNIIGVHHDDGFHGSWDVLVQSRGPVKEASVYTNFGRIYRLKNRLNYSDAWQGWYCGTDGSVLMIVEEEEVVESNSKRDCKSEGEESKCEIEHSTPFASEETGDYQRYTYIPESQIVRVEILTIDPGQKFRLLKDLWCWLRGCLRCDDEENQSSLQ